MLSIILLITNFLFNNKKTHNEDTVNELTVDDMRDHFNEHDHCCI